MRYDTVPTPLSKRFRDILNRGVNATLRARGFRKTRCVFRAKCHHVSWLVNAQRSRWNNAKHLEFTLNCGIYIPGVVSRYNSTHEPIEPNLKDCCLSARVGLLGESRLDKWWLLTLSDSEQEADETIISELNGYLEHAILPFLTGFRSEVDVTEFLTAPSTAANRLISPQGMAQRHAYASLIYARLEDKVKAHEEIERAAEEANGTPIAPIIQSLRRSLLAK